MNNFCVYAYYVPGEEKPFYIGKGLSRRPYVHLEERYRKRRTSFYLKLNKLLDAGVAPIVKILANNLPEQCAFDLEISLIKIYGRLDIGTGCLCNHTNGGEGHSGREVSIDTRIKMSKPRGVEARANHLIAMRKKGVAVESFDLTTGQTIKSYPSMGSVKDDGYNDCMVRRVIQGKQSQHGWYGWRYSKTGA
jgi:hypothetical protein